MNKRISRIVISVEIFVATLLILCIAAQMMLNNDLKEEMAASQNTEETATEEADVEDAVTGDTATEDTEEAVGGEE